MWNLPNIFAPHHRHFGLALGRSSVRAVEVDKKGNFKSYAEAFLPEGTYFQGVLMKKDVFVDTIKKLTTTGKFTTPYVAVSFSEVHAYSRECTFPVVHLEELNEAVSWQVKDLFPFPQDEIYFDWKIREKSDEELTVEVVAVQKKVLDSLVDGIIAAGLKPLGFEPGAAVIARLLKLTAGKQAVVTEVNRKGAYVTLIEGEKALFTTVVNYPREETMEAHSSTLYQTIQEVVLYYQKRKLLKETDLHVILTGEMATSDFVKQIGAKVKYPIKLLTTQINNPAFNKAYAVANSPIFPTHDPNTINLLPPAIQQKYDEEIRYNFKRSLFLRSCVVTGFFCFISLAIFSLATFNRQTLEGRVKFLSGRAKSQKGAETQTLLLLNAQAADIVALAPLRATPKDKLLVMQSLVPSTIHISQWDFDNTNLVYTLQGIADTRTDLLNFREQLENSSEFTKVTLPLGTLETPLSIRFTINFMVE